MSQSKLSNKQKISTLKKQIEGLPYIQNAIKQTKMRYYKEFKDNYKEASYENQLLVINREDKDKEIVSKIIAMWAKIDMINGTLGRLTKKDVDKYISYLTEVDIMSEKYVGYNYIN